MTKLVPLAMALLLVQHHDTAGQFGTVRFANSCAAAVQPSFTRGMALLHSFEFGPAIDAFKAAHDADPGCPTALWGIGTMRFANSCAAAVQPSFTRGMAL